MSPEAKKTGAVAILMAIWWITEAIHISATALLPLALFPLLGITTSKQAAFPYANHLIFLFMGGFIIALSMQKWNLHKRIALNIIKFIGTSPIKIILGFMISSAFLSMWVSNTATTIMMVPIGMAVIQYFNQENNNFALSLMLGIAYAASVGGIGTLIGTPPNLVLANTVEQMYGKTIGFMEWFIVGVPLVIIMIPIIWLWLTKIIYPCKNIDNTKNDGIIKEQIKKLGKISKGEKIVLFVFLLTAFSWVFRQTKEIEDIIIPGLDKIFPQISDAAIAMFFALFLFIIPVNWRKGEFAMDWTQAKKLPWGILILFGGGLSLANGFNISGLDKWIGKQVKLFSNTPEIIFTIVIITVVIFLTEMTSNTATTAMVLPILGSMAIGLGKAPLILMAPAAICASCAFILPVATPPNAIVFGSGYIRIPQMAKAGFFLNIISIFVITLFSYLYLFPILIR